MTLTATRATLATALKTTGIDRVYDTEPDNVQVPCLVVGNPVGTYDDTFDGDITYTFPVVLLVSRAADSQRAIAKIDPYIDPTDDSSVYAVLREVQGARVVGFTNYGAGYEVAGQEYAGVTFEVQVL